VTPLWERLTDWETAAPYAPRDRNAWRWHVAPYPLDDEPSGEWSFGLTVEFPPEDVPAVTFALRSWVDRSATP
jgi:hypothetical protein